MTDSLLFWISIRWPKVIRWLFRSSEVDYIFDLEDDELAAMHVFAKSVALAIQKVFPCKKVGEAVSD